MQLNVTYPQPPVLPERILQHEAIAISVKQRNERQRYTRLRERLMNN
jgi:hypothetical protein